MENAVYVGLSQQMALKRSLDITANNLANMNTTAFKAASPIFEEYLSDTPGTADTAEVSFVQDYGIYQDLTEGSIAGTNRPLDFAISGDGFFTVQTDEGLRYTRNGTFKLDADGYVITSNGDFLVDESNKTIQLDLENPDIEVAADGTVNLGVEDTQKIQLISFDNMQLLKNVGNGYYVLGDAKARPAENASILQGSLENSNVNSILEMTSMIEILRAYEATQKLLDAQNEMMTKAIDILPVVN